MGKRLWSIFGVKNYSVSETSNVLGNKLNLNPKEFQVDYTGRDTGFILSKAPPLHISVMRNYVHTPHGARYTYWYEEKFKQYSVLIYVAAESDELEFPPAKWSAVEKVLDSLDWVFFLYMKEE